LKFIRARMSDFDKASVQSRVYAAAHLSWEPSVESFIQKLRDVLQSDS